LLAGQEYPLGGSHCQQQGFRKPKLHFPHLFQHSQQGYQHLHMLLKTLRPFISRSIHSKIPDEFEHFSIASSHIALAIVEGRSIDGDFPAFFWDVVVVLCEVELSQFFGQPITVSFLEG